VSKSFPHAGTHSHEYAEQSSLCMPSSMAPKCMIAIQTAHHLSGEK
jgi:hypothetical protein